MSVFSHDADDVPRGLSPDEIRAYRDARLLGLCREGALEAARSARRRESAEDTTRTAAEGDT
jgi:hypothetical protein